MFLVRLIVKVLLLAVLSEAFRLNRELRRSKRGTGEVELDFKWFDQILDHFNPSDVEPKWKQRYLVNDEHYDRSNVGPMFLEINGELPITEFSGAGLNYAKTFGAMCFKLEHRYYGKSRPTSDLSNENLRYLSSHQALADIARFIWGMTAHYSLPDGTKWIVFGGSYAGSLAAWSRLKYPHLIHAAIASSPVMAPKVEFADYFDAVEHVITNYDSSCAESIHEATTMFEELMNVTGGAQVLSKLFRLCSDLDPNDKNQVANAANDFSYVFPEIIQSSVVNSSGRIEALDLVCRIMKNEDDGLPIERYSRIDHLLHRHNACRNAAYRSMISSLGNEDNFNSQRQWLWQCCSEIGMFLTSHEEGSMFGSVLDLQYYFSTCNDVLKDKFDESRLRSATEINRIEFGGKSFTATRVAIVSGKLDPWNQAGIIETDDASVIRIEIDGVSHCADMAPIANEDSIHLTEGRKKIESILRKWIRYEFN